MMALEFCLPPDEVARLLRIPGIGRGARPVNADRIWYDTPEGDLKREGLSVCRQRGVWRIEAASPMPRQIWPPGAPSPVLAEAPDLELLGSEGRFALPGTLMPLAGFRGRQRVLPAGGDDQAPATVTIIEGNLRGITQDRPVCRVIMDGSAAQLRDLSSQVAQSVPLTVPRWSLASEAIALARGEPPRSRHTGAPDVAPGTRLTDAVAIVLGHLADVILAAALITGAGNSPEPVHQMRVAVRRLRSAISVFKHAASGPAFDNVKASLKRLAAVLGAARDWDVFLAGTGAAVASALPEDERIAAMLNAGSRRRARTYAELRQMLQSAEFRGIELTLVQLTALRPWDDAEDAEDAEDADRLERLQADVEHFATHQLDRQLGHMLAPGADVSGLPAEALHAIRKTGKRLRYACEFFAPLYGRKLARRFIEHLAVLQEALGHLNDAASAGVLMDSLGRAANQQFAAGAVQGFVAARSIDTRRDIERAWHKFRRQEPFWH